MSTELWGETGRRKTTVKAAMQRERRCASLLLPDAPDFKPEIPIMQDTTHDDDIDTRLQMMLKSK
jgi:hypothetical protein